MARFRKYTIYNFNPKEHTLGIHFYDTESFVNISIPIENNKYITGEELDNYIQTFSAVSHDVCFNQNIENSSEIESLVNNTWKHIHARSDKIAKNTLRRNNLLASCDWTQLPDAQEQLDEEDKKLWKEYRQALRDITKQSGWPLDVDWPKRPHILGVTIFE